MKIVELKIDDSILSGIDAVALVESPAIEQDFLAFNKVSMAEMTWNDYPQAAVDAAKRGIELNKEYNNKCATQVGKVRAQQLANREKLSIETIQRMRSFLIRQKGNFELAQRRKDYSACGYISYLLWGGEAALPWAEKKLRQAGIEFSKFESTGKDIYLISCSNEKADGPAPASELYDSPLFKKSLEFARKKTSDDNIKILSAKYGLVDLDQVIETYDLTLKEMNAEAREQWADLVYTGLSECFNVDKDRFIFLAGNAYTEFLLPKFKYNTDLLEGKRIGERMAYLDKFYVVTNDLFYAVQFSFNNVEEDLVEAVIEQDLFEGLEDACQPGYKAIGLKSKNGRLVPNCVPEDSFAIDAQGLPNYINEASTGGRKKDHFSELKEKQMLVGPLMTPGKLIPRVDDNGDEYQVFFSKDTIEKIAYKMMQDKLVDSVNIEHDGAQKVNDVYLVETWIVKDPTNDKANLYGFTPVEGEWYGMYKVNNKPVWDEYVKTGKVKGFSVEGYFYNNLLTNK